jgi:hypothetical protein
MYIQIAADNSLSLEDTDNMKAFSIVEAVTGQSVMALAEIAEAAGDNHYWIDANAVIQLSSQNDNPQWVNGFWDMLKMVEAYGYSDMENKRVKAHVESS